MRAASLIARTQMMAGLVRYEKSLLTQAFYHNERPGFDKILRAFSGEL